MARPTKLDASTSQIICAAIRRGLGYEQAATLANIDYSTLRKWILRAEAEQERLEQPRTRLRQKEQPFIEFYEALQRAKTEGELTNADIVAAAAKGGQEYTETRVVQQNDDGQLVTTEQTITTKITLPDWRAAAFILERRHPERWTRHQKTELSGPGGQPIKITNIEAVAPDDNAD